MTEWEQFANQEIIGSFIAGAFLSSSKQEAQPLKSPLTGETWKTVLPADRQDVRQAIDSAQDALVIWKKVPAPRRAEILRQIGTMLSAQKQLLAETMAKEMGKTLKDGWAEVEYTASYFQWFAGEAERLYGTLIPSRHAHKHLSIFPEPVGVCGVITPWNFPLAMAGRKIAAALAAGCTLVVKPSTECPMSMLLLAEMGRQAGLLPGTLNIVLGSAEEIGEELLQSPLVKKIAFTGSTPVGRYLYEKSAPTLKKLTLELGGHAPAIVFEDADLDLACDELIKAKFRNNGQTCISPNRFLIHEKIYDDFCERFVSKIKRLKSGHPLDPETDLTNILHKSVLEKVPQHIDDALAKGARYILNGQEPYAPIVLGEVTQEMRIFHEETFGPVAPLIRFSSTEEGLRLANTSAFGLSAYVFTKSILKALQAITVLEYGVIGVNDGLPSSAETSFGGRKDSGFGREGGPTGISEYIIEKFVSLNPGIEEAL